MALHATRTSGCSGCLIDAIVRHDERRLRHLLSDASAKFSDTYLMPRESLLRRMAIFRHSIRGFRTTQWTQLAAKAEHCASGARGDAGARKTCKHRRVRRAHVYAAHKCRLQLTTSARRQPEVRSEWTSALSHATRIRVTEQLVANGSGSHRSGNADLQGLQLCRPELVSATGDSPAQLSSSPKPQRGHAPDGAVARWEWRNSLGSVACEWLTLFHLWLLQV